MPRNLLGAVFLLLVEASRYPVQHNWLLTNGGVLSELATRAKSGLCSTRAKWQERPVESRPQSISRLASLLARLQSSPVIPPLPPLDESSRFLVDRSSALQLGLARLQRDSVPVNRPSLVTATSRGPACRFFSRLRRFAYCKPPSLTMVGTRINRSTLRTMQHMKKKCRRPSRVLHGVRPVEPEIRQRCTRGPDLLPGSPCQASRPGLRPVRAMQTRAKASRERATVTAIKPQLHLRLRLHRSRPEPEGRACLTSHPSNFRLLVHGLLELRHR